MGVSLVVWLAINWKRLRNRQTWNLRFKYRHLGTTILILVLLFAFARLFDPRPIWAMRSVRTRNADATRVVNAETVRGRLIEGVTPDETASVVPALANLLNDPDAEVRLQAAKALYKIGPHAESAVPALITSLQDSGFGGRWMVAQALGEIGPAARPAIPALAEVLNDPNPDLRKYAGEALQRLNYEPKTFASILVSQITIKFVTYRSVVQLGQLGPDAVAAVPVLIEVLKEEESPEPYPNHEHLSNEMLKSRMELLRVERRWLRCAAARSLGRIGPLAAEAIPALTETLNNTDLAVREAAAEALVKIQPER